MPVIELEARITEPPWQKVTAPKAVIEAVVIGITVMLCVTEAEAQPLDTVKVYMPAALTEIVGVVAPVDQLFPLAEPEDRVTEPPAQKLVGPLAVMLAVMVEGITVTAMLEEAVPQTVATFRE